MINFSKPKYPEKQVINLAMQETDRVDPRIQIGCFVVFLVCLAVFVKFAVINRIQMAEDAQRAYEETERQIQMLEERTKDFDEVRKVYRQFDNAFLSESEASEQDRMEIMEMVEECVLKKADMRSIAITANQVRITVEDTTLSDVSEIVSKLEDDEKTAYVTVSTAGTDEGEKRAVSADIVVQLKNGGETDE